MSSQASYFTAIADGITCPEQERRRPFVPIAEAFPLRARSLRDEILGFVSGSPFPASKNLRAGRSVYGALTEEGISASEGISGVKMKGAGGLLATSPLTFEYLLPSPKERFETKPIPHLSLSEELDGTIVHGTPRALRSLSSRSAEREFICHQRLSALGIAAKPLLCGYYVNDGTREKDFLERDTGCVVVESYPNAKELLYFTHFGTIEVIALCRDIPASMTSPYLRGRSVESCLENFLGFTERIGELKRRAAYEGGVLRHAGHLFNFFYDPKADKLLLTDLDSCLLREELTERAAAAQLLRDISVDCLRYASAASYYGGSLSLVSQLKEGKIDLFTPFLRGFFKHSVSSAVITAVGQHLSSAFGIQLLSEQDLVCRFFRARGVAIQLQQPDKFRGYLGGWNWQRSLFLSKVMEAVYTLLQASGEKVHEISPDVRKRKFEQSARLLFDALSPKP